MYKLPRPVSEALVQIAATGGDGGRLASAVVEILSSVLSCADLARAVDAFRESARSLGLLEESRNGQRVYDAWCKLVAYQVSTLERLRGGLEEASEEPVQVPDTFDVVGARWERTFSEVVALMEELADLDAALAESPVSTHVGHRIRSRLLLLDRRSERVKVALDILQRELASAAKAGAQKLAEANRELDR